MEANQPDMVILGGGLTGLTIAYLLKKEGLFPRIIEARDRLGGRIHSRFGQSTAPLEMGATWLGKKHRNLINLLEELEIGIFEQRLGEWAIFEPISTSPPQIVKLPPNSDPSYRIQGGTSNLIKTLVGHLQEDQVLTGQRVRSIHQEAGFFTLETDSGPIKTKMVISTLPPRLLIESIEISPSLPQSLLSVARKTHTWMGESIKIGLTYTDPFWREEHTSGTIFSNVGPISEMYDHSNEDDTLFALKGFMSGAYFVATKEERIKVVMNQLARYYGDRCKKFITYEEAVWRNEPYTFAEYQSPVLPHQNNGDAVFRQSYLNGDFFIAGAETAPDFPGYMEGAVQSAYFVSQQVKERFGL